MLCRALHRWSILWWITVLLYGAHASAAMDAPAPLAPPPVSDSAKSPHIALLLPTGSESFAKAADAVREGFAEAAKKQTGAPLTIRLYPVGEDVKVTTDTYRQAI